MHVRISLTALSADEVIAGIAVVEAAHLHQARKNDAEVAHLHQARKNDAEVARELWCEGAYVVSEQEPRLVVYPNFLASDEADYLSELARWGALEAAAAASMSGIVVQSAKAVSWDGSRPARSAASGRTASIHLPRPCDDPAIQAIEERCAAATVRPPQP